MKITALVLAVLFAATTAQLQTVAPISEDFGHGKALTQVTIQNNQLTPLAVSLSAGQFIVKDGQKQIVPMEPDVLVKIAQTSFRIPPKQTRIIDYQVFCPRGCNVEISATMAAPSMRVQNGMLVKLQMGSICYVCADSAKDCRKKVLLAGGVQP
jgi:hypothetical protein